MCQVAYGKMRTKDVKPGVSTMVLKKDNLYKEEKNIVQCVHESGFEWILHSEVCLNEKGNILMIDLNLWCTYEENDEEGNLDLNV